MENRIFRKSISFDRVFYGFDSEIGLHFYFHFKPFSNSDAQRERERERERELKHRHTAGDAQNPSSPVMPRTTPRHTASSSHASHSADPSLVLVLRRPIPHPRLHQPTSIDPSLVRTNPYLQIKFYGLKSHRQTQIGVLLSCSRHR